jgi:PPP family 3-phenylpropionic acid transporter
MNLRPALPFAVFYGAVFLMIGVHLPFWPLWLEGRGLDAAEIGVVIGVAAWVRVATTPALAYLSDRSGQGKWVIVGLAAISLGGFALFGLAAGFWALLALNCLTAITFTVLLPLGDSRTMAAVGQRGLDYGRVRLWGSLTFIAGSVGAGWWLDGRPVDWVLWLVIGAVALTLAATLGLPGDDRDPAPGPREGHALELLTQRPFLLFVAAAGCLHASHALYYGFSALHWRAAGLSEVTIGWLWAIGVIAEVILFAAGGRVVTRLGPAGLLALAGAAGVLRWTVLAFTTAVAPLALVQVLHAFTFGAAHLGAMHFIARAAPAAWAASAQGLYTALSTGLIMGAMMLAAGWLYESLGGAGFLVMAGASLGGLLLAFALPRPARSPSDNALK